MAYIVECKRVCNANVLFYFEFTTGEPTATPCTQLSADKWLSLHNWNSIYKPLESFVTKLLPAPDSPSSSIKTTATFSIPKTELSFTADWLQLDSSPIGRSADSFLRAASSSAKDDGQHQLVHSHFVHITVQPTITSKADEYIADLEERLKELQYKLKKHASSSTKSKSSANPPNSSSSRNGSSHPPQSHRTRSQTKPAKPPVDPRPPDEEYIPNAVKGSVGRSDAITYKPSSLHVDIPAHEPYVPTDISPTRNGCGAAPPRYEPSPNSDAETVKSATDRKTEPAPVLKVSSSSSNRKKAPDSKLPLAVSGRTQRKRCSSSDMFDTDDEPVAVALGATNSSSTLSNASTGSAKAGPRSHSLRNRNVIPSGLTPPQLPIAKRVKPVTTADTSQHPAKLQTKPSRRPAPATATGDKRKKTPAAEPSAANSYLVKMTAEQMDAQTRKHQREIEDMAKMRKLLAAKPLPQVEVVDLKHLSLAEIGDRFAASEPKLREIFAAYCGGKIFQVKRPPDVSEFAVNYLLDNKQQLYMMDMLTTAFGGNENLSAYDDLFWKTLLPEWSVALFMHSYKFTRTEATQRMRQQEIISQANFRVEEVMDETVLDADVSFARRK